MKTFTAKRVGMQLQNINTYQTFSFHRPELESSPVPLGRAALKQDKRRLFLQEEVEPFYLTK